MTDVPFCTEGLHASLVERLWARRSEIEQEILARTHAISKPTIGDPEYVVGLRAAVSAGVGFGIAGLEAGEGDPGPVPAELLGQARRAARGRIGLETVLRRCLAGYGLFTNVILQEVGRSTHIGVENLQALGQTTLFDRLVDAIAKEYKREVAYRSRSLEQRRADCVERLLIGEATDPTDLGYDLDAWHLGAVVAGPDAAETVRSFAFEWDRELLVLSRGEDIVWAWFGYSHKAALCELEGQVGSTCPPGVSLATGEPAHGLHGWRITHHQAVAALPVALQSAAALTRYADVALLASVLQDGVLSTSLIDIYLTPLSVGRGGGATLRQTLRAYFSAGRNASSAAAALGVNRKTVASRLRTVEQRLGRTVDTCAAEIETALRLADLHRAAAKDSVIYTNL